MELAIDAGSILLENGAEIFRVEETMDRICRSYGVKSANEFVLTNGIFATVGDVREQVFAKVQTIPVGGAHLDKVAAVNQLSREIEEGKYDIEKAMEMLRQIREMPEKTKWEMILASGIGSASICYLLGGSLWDALPALVAGTILYVYVIYISRPHLSKIVGNIGGGALVTMLCSLMYLAGFGQHTSYMIIGSIIPLIPGVAFTNAIRDIVYDDYLSGWVRLLDTLVVFFCIAMGVGLGTFLMQRLTGGVL